MRDYEKVRERKREVLGRVSRPDEMYKYCRVPGCHNPATAGTSKGLNRLYCRHHEDHFERHGSYLKKTYRASEINPYRKAAFKWITENQEKFFVSLALQAIRNLYQKAGPAVPAFRLCGMKPQERARVAWARLREKGVDPRVPLAAWLAVEMILLDEPQPENKPEFKRVQAAKIIHRQASGTHKQWEHQRSDGRTWVERLDKYPPSRGLVLRHIGKQLEKAAEWATHEYLRENHSLRRKGGISELNENV